MEGTRKDMQETEELKKAFNNMTGGKAFSPHASDMPSDVTQRVRIDSGSRAPVRQPASAAPQRDPSRPARQTGNQPQRKASPAPASRKTDSGSKRNKVTVITLCTIASVLLIAVIVTLCIMFASPEDNGLILNNVYAAGVNLGGKTPEQAKKALSEATSDTYTKLDMIVEVHNSKQTLTPAKTGAKLDVDAVVEAAYNYGRVGSRAERQMAKNQALTSSYVISILPYLNLDSDYIQDIVDTLGSEYSSTLSQPSYRVDGVRPDLNMKAEDIDINKAYQTLYITVGTAEYGLDTDKLYDQIMEAYNNNIFQVVGEISVVSPEALDLEALYAELCVTPVDAILDEVTYEVTPETYGYGFYIDEARELLDNAEYGDEIQIPLSFIRPKVTEEELKDGLFEKIIATYTTPTTEDKELIINLKLASRAFPNDGLILKVDEVFSFNDFFGQLTEEKGYKEVADITEKKVLGGGISRLSSALYYCALMSDMEILERINHIYTPSFIEPGLDADISYGSIDLQFKNTTGRPVRIELDVSDDGTLKVDIWGTSNKERTVEILYETVNTYNPSTLTNIMLEDNPDGYKAGDILITPIIGYDICTYKVYRYTNADPDTEPTKKLIAFSHYNKQDKVIVEIQKDPERLPTTPGEPTEESSNPGSKPTENTASGTNK